MTNGNKFVTTQERADAFNAFCDSQGDCARCKACTTNQTRVNKFCHWTWLDLEAEEEKPLPCIWCGHETYVCEGQNYGQVRCKNCMAEGPATDSREHAIRNYNRVAKAVRESEEKK